MHVTARGSPTATPGLEWLVFKTRHFSLGCFVLKEDWSAGPAATPKLAKAIFLSKKLGIFPRAD
jgi:hypothetical protein